jgi:uncharacterized protein YndB with AHSA1/START domain
MTTTPITYPDLSIRPFKCTVEHAMSAPPHVIYRAWTEKMDKWFAAPGTVLMRPEVNAVFFFETVHQHDKYGGPFRHPHYGRFLKLEPDKVVELTWLSGVNGTEGEETVVTVELKPHGTGTLLKLTHAGFGAKEAMKRHEQAWPTVLKHLDAMFPAGK